MKSFINAKNIEMPDSNILISIVGDCSNWNMPNLKKGDIQTELITKLCESDIFIFNLEGPIADSTKNHNGPIKSKIISKFLNLIGKPQMLVVNSEPILKSLEITKINIACLANNHILDAGKEGLINTINILKSNNFFYVGADIDIKSASKPLIFELKNQRVGIFNFNYIGWRKFGFFLNPFGATYRTAGANYKNPKKVIQEISKYKKMLDYCIVIFHIGQLLNETISSNDEKFLCSIDADIIIVHHAHISQKTNSNKIYSCGDFLFNCPHVLPNGRKSAVILLSTVGDKEIITTRINDGLPCLL